MSPWTATDTLTRKQQKVEGRHHSNDCEGQCSQLAANCPVSRTAISAMKTQWEIEGTHRRCDWEDRRSQATAAHLFPHGSRTTTRTEWELEDMHLQDEG